MGITYEVRTFDGRDTVFTVSVDDALTALDRDGTITAVRDSVGRIVWARVNGHLLNARDYRAYLDLTDGGRVRAAVDRQGKSEKNRTTS